MNLGPLLYQFVIGGIIFALGLVIPWRAGDYSWARREDRRTILFMLAGVVLYLVLQTLWQLSATGAI